MDYGLAHALAGEAKGLRRLEGYLVALLLSALCTLTVAWLQNAIRGASGEVHRPYTILYVCVIAPVVFRYGIGPGITVFAVALTATYVWLTPGLSPDGGIHLRLRDSVEMAALSAACGLVIWASDRHRRQSGHLMRALADLEAMHEVRERVLADVLRSVTQGKFLLYASDDAMPALLSGQATVRLAKPIDLSALRAAIRASRPLTASEDDRFFRFLTAAHESAMNAIVHGGGGMALVGFTDENRETLAVQISDQGPGIALENLPERALQGGISGANSLGMGFSLVLDGADRIHLRTTSRGTRVLLELDREPPAPVWFTRLLGE